VQGVADGTHLIFLIAGLVCTVALVEALAIKEVPLRSQKRQGVDPIPADPHPGVTASANH